MTITSAAAMSGIKTAMVRTDVSSNDISNINTAGYCQVTPQQTDVHPAGVRISNLVRTPNNNAELSNTDLAFEAVELKTAKTTLSACVAAIKAQDRMTGEIIDLTA